MNAGTKDPDCGIGSVSAIGRTPMARVCDYGSQKRLCRLYNVRKPYRPLSLSYRTKFARDRFARCDTFQEIYANGFFHDEYYADLSHTCSRGCILAPSAIDVGIVFRRSRSTFAQGGTRCPQRVGTNSLRRNSYSARPTAAATARRRGTSPAKISGVSAWLPSLLAISGESCTSIMSASAPAATAARHICGTNSR